MVVADMLFHAKNRVLGVTMNLLSYIPIFTNSKEDPVSEDLVEVVFSILFLVLILLVFVNYKVLQYLDENYTWVRREWRLLDALSKDIQTANKSVNQIKQRANQVWESELNLRGLTQPMSEIESEWAKKEGKLASDAQRCVEKYEKLIADNRGGSFHFSVLNNSVPIVDLFFEMRRIKEEIKSYLEQKKESKNVIVEKLAESRIKIRRLQERPVDEIDTRLPSRTEADSDLGSELITEIKNLAGGLGEQFIVMQLKLLRSFVFEDLLGLRVLESEIEKVWLEEARKITEEAEKAIKTFKTEKRKGRVFVLGWFWRRKCKKILKDIGNEFSYLLERKERYGFNFIRRDSSKDANQLQQPLEDSTSTSTSTVTSSSAVRSQNDEELIVPSSTSTVPVPNHENVSSSLRNELENVEKALKKDQETTDGVSATRKTCFEVLNEMKKACDAESSTVGIQEALELVKRYMHAYRIKVMKEYSCSAVGLEDDIHELVLEILAAAEGEHRSIISIVGMKGIGKTTLAKEILRHTSIIKHFSAARTRFVSLPRDYSNEIILLQEVGNQILKTENRRNEREYWIKEMRDFLRKSPCLVVLNNLRSTEVWDILKPAVFLDGSKATIVLTARDKAVASHANPNPSSIHRLRLRTGEESWEFFTQMVQCPSDVNVEKLARRVVARTGGLPLAISRLGYLLSGKTVTSEELSRALERITQGENQTPWIETWNTNKQELQLRPVIDNCLSYFELFPRDFEVPARRLVALWVAQGLMAQSELNANELKTQEKVAYDYLSELIDRNIIQVVERKLNGKVLTCRFPGTIRELWLGGRQNNRTARSWSLCASFDRKLAYRFDDDDASCGRGIHDLDHSKVLPEERYPLLIVFFDTREGNKPGEDIRNFLSKGIKTGRLVDLVVLDLEDVFKPQLPSMIGKLRKLTYLGLRRTFIENLPSSIGELLNLQTLDLKHTSLQKLPGSIWKLKKLRHLHLGESRIESMPQPNTISMKDLHKLSGVFVDHEGRALLDRLHKLNNLRKLGLAFHLTPQQQEELAKRILLLTHLHSLSLKSVNENKEPQELKLEALNNLTNLTSLNLFGKIERQSIMFELPESLTELTLSGSGLSRGGLLLQMLGNHLPQLKYLSFLSNSYHGTQMVFSKGFPQLLVLKLWSLDNLEKLFVEEGSMEKLREFEIRSCVNLKLSCGLTKLSTTLRELKLTDMPEEYTTRVKNDFSATAQEQSLDKIVHFPAIKISNIRQPNADQSNPTTHNLSSSNDQ